MKQICLLLFFTLLSAGCATTDRVQDDLTTAEASTDRVAYTLFNDFETGELFSWEPYPYQQDIGYDALYFTRDEPVREGSRYALARPVNANDTVELYKGFTRRLNMWTTPDTRVQLAVFLQSDRNPETLELTLGTFGGNRYRHTIENPEANVWLELDIPGEAFELDGQPLSAGEHIQVVTLKASYPIVYYLHTYTILMDEFQINGERQRRFRAIEPGSTDFEKFHTSILNRHYYHGDTISMRVVSERGAALQQVTGTLVDSRGRVVRDDIEFTRRDGMRPPGGIRGDGVHNDGGPASRDGEGVFAHEVNRPTTFGDTGPARGDEWVNDSVHRVSEIDETGRWELRLTGKTEKGRKVRWKFEFLVPGERLSGHPRLFFSAEELADRLENEDSPTAQRILDNALADTRFMDVNLDEIEEGVNIPGEAFTFGPYGKYRELRIQGWRPPLYTLRDVIRNGSFHYAFTGDREAGEQAREALIKLCNFNQWNADWFVDNRFWTYYPLGYVLQAVGIGYDMLHDLLSEEEKQLVRDAIMEKALKPFYRDMIEMKRMPSHATNHLSVLVSGYGMAATAIYGEDPDNPWMEPYLSGILTRLEAFVNHTYYEDGSYAEPIGYHGHATNNIVQIFDVLERNFGLDYSTTTGVRNFYYMPLQGSDPVGQIQDFGDFNVRNRFDFSATRSQWFVRRLGDPYLYHYVKPYWEDGNGGFLGFLWFRDDISPIARNTLPTSRIFDARGMIMRSGWDDKSTVIHTRVGPNSNHYHYDMGSFQIQTNGQELLTDPGVGYGGYYGNLAFTHYNMQSVGHNVMLVDHDPESQAPGHYDNNVAALRDWPRMVHAFTGDIADAMEGDLATVYKGKLDLYTRTLLYIKDGPLFLFDRVESRSPDGHVYNWLFHAPQEDGYERTLSYEDQRMLIDRANARLTMDVLLPQIESASVIDNNDRRHPETMVSLTSYPDLAEATFFAVLLPEARPTGADFDPRPETQRIDAPGWIGARVERTVTTDYGFFRTGKDTAVSAVEGFVTDAGRFTVSFDEDGNLLKVYFEGTNWEGRGLSLNSDEPVSLAIAPGISSGQIPEATGMQIEVQSEQETRIAVGMDQRPFRVLLNGEETGDWQYTTGDNELTIRIPAGRHDIAIRFSR